MGETLGGLRKFREDADRFHEERFGHIDRHRAEVGQFVIISDDGRYVAPGGRPSSYTSALQNALVFSTRAAALAECCGNERVIER